MTTTTTTTISRPNPMELKQVRINGRSAREYVRARKPFRNSNNQLYSLWETPLLYVVYSYGSHWPLFVWDGFQWYENEERYSRTTTQHRSNAHPHGEVQRRSCAWLKQFIRDRVKDYTQMARTQASLGLVA